MAPVPPDRVAHRDDRRDRPFAVPGGIQQQRRAADGHELRDVPVRGLDFLPFHLRDAAEDAGDG